GVPREMMDMFERCVVPHLPSGASASPIVQRTIKTFGIPESEVGEKIADLMARGRNPTVGTSAADLIISIRINARAASHDEAIRLAGVDAAEIRKRLGIAIFGAENDTVQSVVGKMLIAARKTVSTAE